MTAGEEEEGRGEDDSLCREEASERDCEGVSDWRTHGKR